jgi:hypothetical protein
MYSLRLLLQRRLARLIYELASRHKSNALILNNLFLRASFVLREIEIKMRHTCLIPLYQLLASCMFVLVLVLT